MEMTGEGNAIRQAWTVTTDQLEATTAERAGRNPRGSHVIHMRKVGARRFDKERTTCDS
jgi:hypothetical protein